MSTTPKAFVMMPFDEEFLDVYQQLIKPALEDAGYEVQRADSLMDQQNIMRDIVQGIASARLIVADLTTLNPNVLYELGLAHGLGIPTVLLTQSLDDVPFDLRSYRIQVYSTRFDEAQQLTDALREIGSRHAQEAIQFGSPVSDFLDLKPRTEAEPQVPSDEKPKEQGSLRAQEEEEEDKGLLDFIVEGNQASEQVTALMAQVTKETETIGDKFRKHTDQIQRVAGSGSPGSAAQGYRISLLAATDLSRYSQRVEELLPQLEDGIDLFLESAAGYASWRQPKGGSESDRLKEYRQTIQGIREAAGGSLEGIRGFRQSIETLRGFSREINRASRKAGGTLDRLIGAVERVEASCGRIVALIDERLQEEPDI